MDSEIITSDDILGKEVVDIQGEVLGIIQKLHIDKVGKKIVGITVDQGFMKPDLYIGLENIKQFGVDTVFLNTFPRSKIKGMEVINSKGKKVGIVSEVVYAGRNRLKAIKVKHNALKEEEEIHVSAIKQIGYNVLLKE